MEVILHIIIFYFVLINSIYYIYIDFINKYFKKVHKFVYVSHDLMIINQILLVVFNIDVFTKINILFFYITFIFFKLSMIIINNKRMYFIVLINIYFIFKNTMITTLFDLILLIEIFNLSLNLFILNDCISKINFKKSVYIILITLNVFSLTLFSILYCLMIVLFKTTNLCVISLILKTQQHVCINLLIYSIMLIKLGFLVGPKFTKNLYLMLPNTVICVYVYYYYVLFPYILLPILNIIFINQYIFIPITILLILSNVYYFTPNYTIQHLLFISNQINLVYIQLLFV